MTRSPKERLDQIEDASELLVLVQGVDDDGAPFWAYVAMSPAAHRRFMAEGARGGELSDFGTILEHGRGEAPPADVVRRMTAG